MTLNTSDETLEELQRQATALATDAASADAMAAAADDDRVKANLMGAKAKFLAIRATVLTALHRIQTTREAAGGGSLEDPDAELRTVEELRRRGWWCERENPLPRIVQVLEGHPEAKEAVLRVVGAGGVKT